MFVNEWHPGEHGWGIQYVGLTGYRLLLVRVGCGVWVIGFDDGARTS